MSDDKDRDGGRVQIDTGGGPAYVGDITVQDGDFVGKQKIVVGDEVRGDKAGGDKIATGDIAGSTVAMGRSAEATATAGPGGRDLARLLAAVYRRIEARPPDPKRPPLPCPPRPCSDRVSSPCHRSGRRIVIRREQMLRSRFLATARGG